MANSIAAEAEAFATEYSKLFTSPACSSSDSVAEIAREVGKRYRPGVTFFTGGHISRFESQPEAARLIEQKMRANITSGIGTYLELLEIVKTEAYSSTSALCWLKWKFHPKAGGEFEGKTWDVY